WKKTPYCRLDQSEAHPGSVDKRASLALWHIATIRRARPRWRRCEELAAGVVLRSGGRSAFGGMAEVFCRPEPYRFLPTAEVEHPILLRGAFAGMRSGHG